jgi:hypothetical protein
MTRIFHLKKFLRHIDDQLLLEFFKNQSIEPTLTERDEKEKPEEYWERTITALDSKSFQIIELAFQEVYGMAYEGGILLLLQFFNQKHPAVHKKIESHNAYNQALILYMENTELFRKVSAIAYISDKKIKAERKRLKKIPMDQVVERRPYLSVEIRNYLVKNEARGKNCHVDVYQDAEKVYFIAYPEDYVRPDLHYDGDQLIRSTKKPSFEIVFIYYPNEGKVELSCKGGKKRQIALFNIFNQTVLQDSRPILDYQTLYNLDKVLDNNFELITKLEDEIETVQVKKIRLTDRHNKNRQIYLQIEGKGIKPIQEEAQHRNVDLKTFTVTQVSFGLKFPGKGRRGSVTMELTAPDRCNLNESDLHKRAKHYISYWGLDYQATTQDPS